MIFYKIKKKNTKPEVFTYKSGAKMHETANFEHSHKWSDIEDVKKSLKYYFSRAEKNIKNMRRQAALLREQDKKSPAARYPNWRLSRAMRTEKNADIYEREFTNFKNNFEVVKYETLVKDTLSIEEVSHFTPKPEKVTPPSIEEDIIDGI